MKRTLIITLLLLVAAFSFGQTNSTFNNLDVRNTTKLRGLIYPFGAVATSPINTAVHEIAMINNTTFALCRMDFKEFADSIANYLNPIIGTHWERTGNYLYPKNLPDSVGIGTAAPIERLDVQNGNINLDTSSATSGQIKQNGNTVFHTYHEKGDNNLFIGQGAGNFTADSSFNIGIGNNALKELTTGHYNIAIGYKSLMKNESGVSNTSCGYLALSENLSVYNSAFGSTALAKNTSGYHNSAFGMNALSMNIDGYHNSAFGQTSLSQNSSGDANSAFGHASMTNNTTGNNNTAFGKSALSFNVGNNSSTAIGYNAMYYADNRSSGRTTYNTAVGYEAMKGSSTAANNTGQYNTAVGYQSLTAMTDGEKNTSIGSYSLFYNTTGDENVAVGETALYSNMTGYYNTAIGRAALQQNTSNRNTGIGYTALALNTIGYQNTAIGANALGGITKGHNNIGIGYNALLQDSTGNYNVVIGKEAGFANVSGSSNIFLGYNAGYNETGSNKLYIENSNADSNNALIFGNFATDKLTINGDLKVNGDVTYEYIHLVAYTSGGSYTPNTVSNVEFKLAPGFITAENDGLTFAGDTVTIITPGDYMVQFSTVFQGANGDDWLFKCRKNGTAITSGNLALTTTGAGNYCSGSWFWYLPGLVAGDDISFSVTNEGANNDPTFRSVKIYVDKKPE